MSASYQIVCLTCKKYVYMGPIRDVSIVHWANLEPDEVRQIDVCGDWDSYDRVFIRSALVFIIFQTQHKAHDVRIVTEYDAIWQTEIGGGFYGNAETLGYTEVFKPLLYDNDI